MSRIRRRQFIFSWAALLAPRLVHAQQPKRTRRVGVLMGYAESDPAAQLRISVFRAELAAQGWKEGGNLRIDIRWSSAKADLASAFAKELLALQPDVILCSTTSATAAVQRETRSIPIVFVVVSDPIGSGFVKTLAQPALEGGRTRSLVRMGEWQLARYLRVQGRTRLCLGL